MKQHRTDVVQTSPHFNPYSAPSVSFHDGSISCWLSVFFFLFCYCLLLFFRCVFLFRYCLLGSHFALQFSFSFSLFCVSAFGVTLPFYLPWPHLSGHAFGSRRKKKEHISATSFLSTVGESRLISIKLRMTVGWHNGFVDTTAASQLECLL